MTFLGMVAVSLATHLVCELVHDAVVKIKKVDACMANIKITLDKQTALLDNLITFAALDKKE